MSEKTPLYDAHASAGAKIVDFAGWQLPVQYSGIIAEHKAVRSSAGMFDIGHMGQIEMRDLDALQSLTTNDVSKLSASQGQYSFMCNEKGGVMDDLLVYKLEDRYFVVSNAVNARAVFAKLSSKDKSAKMLYGTRTSIALQGPDSTKILQKFTDTDLSLFKHRQINKIKILDFSALISRSGYSGEDGFEIFFDHKDAVKLWEALLEAGVVPCGLGSRDTLRIEAALPLYGHEIDINTTPFKAGYYKTVKFDKGEFSGRSALLAEKDRPREIVLVGFVIDEKAIPRQGCRITCDGIDIGAVTSGTFSPTLIKPIGIAYASKEAVDSGKEIKIDIRGTTIPVRIVPLPFYRRKPL